MLKKLLFLVLTLFILPGGCTKPKLKSPCIKNNASIACTDRYSINDHWLKSR
ncbi:type IV secretion system protein VirB7 [Wolbachia pipientis]|uniref:Type IV secretion system protein VirB7 n=1 Tax=Wolbachia pipientis TaxID=955 RepID=A0A1E7QKP8_WOLPI|nr:type IV secretion system protein VirB7 [Wolbachia pipientis]OEY87051.1 type IV secretion system protein VirB7 [Wolbachia pipientis]